MLHRLPTPSPALESDALEIGLMAACCPDFAALMADRLFLLTEAEQAAAAAEAMAATAAPAILQESSR